MVATGFMVILVLGLRSQSWVVELYCKVSELYVMVHLLVPEYPSCLQTTLASNDDHKSSQTVPHMLKRQISTRPWFGRLPPTSRTLPWLQGAAVSILHIMSKRHKTRRSQTLSAQHESLVLRPVLRWYCRSNQIAERYGNVITTSGFTS